MEVPEPDFYFLSDLQQRWNCSATAIYSLIHRGELQPSVPTFAFYYSNENARAVLYMSSPDGPDAHAKLRTALHEVSAQHSQSDDELDAVFGPEPFYDAIAKRYPPASMDWIATHSWEEIAEVAVFMASDVEACEQGFGGTGVRRVQTKQEMQCDTIIKILHSFGYEPTKLPVTRGNEGAKRRVRERALQNRTLFTDSSFDKAWDRLRGDGLIADA